MGLICNHSDCLHRGQDRACQLLAQGQDVILNVAGQCEMRMPRPTQYGCRHCDSPAMGQCLACGDHICPSHLSWTVKKHTSARSAHYCVECAMLRIEQLMED